MDLKVVAERLLEARVQCVHNPAVLSTTIWDDKYAAFVSLRNILVSIPFEHLRHFSEMSELATEITRDIDELKYDVQSVVYSPTCNLPSVFIPHKAVFNGQEHCFRLWMSFYERGVL